MRYLIALFCCAALAEEGIRPRPDANDYPAHGERNGAVIGAALLTADQVRGSFSSDLNRGYAVVEVGLFPRGPFELSQGDFSLRVAGSKTVSRPVAPKTIAEVLQKRAPASRDIAVVPTVGIGYESGPVYDPATGRRRGGWTTSTGVGVGIGGPGDRPASTDKDRSVMEEELKDKGLPEGKISGPTAGYLYFPVPSRKKNAAYELEYYSGGDRLVLPLK